MIAISLIASLVLSARPCPVTRGAAEDPAMISRATFVEGRLWVRSDDGRVRSTTPDDSSLRLEHLLGPALDLCTREHKLIALTCKQDDGWEIAERSGDDWRTLASVTQRGEERPVALSCDGKQLHLLTTRRLLTVSDAVHEVKLGTELPAGLVVSTHASGASIYVGYDAGEWGGGLRRVDTTSGRVVNVEKNESGDLCGGPLNAKCDPVNAIASEPWSKGCVVAAIGLLHFGAKGRLTEICGDQVKALFEPQRSEAFFGLVQTGDSLLASSPRGLYRVTQKGIRHQPLPAFRKIDGLSVSFQLPGVVLIRTGINARASVSGAVPMLIPR
jgi:hypothetical protein